jgi:16S rRNA (cytidine1402-2'-O)-methyltransferase
VTFSNKPSDEPDLEGDVPDADATQNWGAAPDGKINKLSAGLTIVATPIGNLGDITIRALAALRDADLIAAEDTRVTASLLRRYALKTPLVPYHDHNADAMLPRLLADLKAGRKVVLVSDAGTPLVSDPGFDLVRACVADGIPITHAPGPCAAITGLVLAGLPSDRFFFAGFLPPKSAARRTALAELRAVPSTLIFYETGPRLADTLADMADILGGVRQGVVARELTKLFEEVRRGPLSDLAAHYAAADQARGELVVLVGPPVAMAALTPEDLDLRLTEALQSHSLKDAAALVALETGLPKRDLYNRALELRR